MWESISNATCGWNHQWNFESATVAVHLILVRLKPTSARNGAFAPIRGMLTNAPATPDSSDRIALIFASTIHARITPPAR
jgi:hypothetical protein